MKWPRLLKWKKNSSYRCGTTRNDNAFRLFVVVRVYSEAIPAYEKNTLLPLLGLLWIKLQRYECLHIQHPAQ